MRAKLNRSVTVLVVHFQTSCMGKVNGVGQWHTGIVVQPTGICHIMRHHYLCREALIVRDHQGKFILLLEY